MNDRRDVANVTDVTVIGAGIAGTGAALGLAEALIPHGGTVTIIVGPAGATQLAPGVFDGEHDADGARILTRLGGFALGECAVATLAGIVRSGSGHDRALLDLAKLRGEVLVPRALRHGWDADALARAFSASPLAQRSGLSFRAFDAGIVRYADERFIADAAIAARHDEEDRLGWMAERLRAGLATAGGAAPAAILLPPWLGANLERASVLGAALGVTCGEIAVGLAGPAGFRFAAARDRALLVAGVHARSGFVQDVQSRDDAVVVELEGGERFETRVCVLATGGLVGGGLRYQPSDANEAAEYPIEARPYVRASLANAPVGVHGRLLGAPGSLFGVAPEAIAWPFVEDSDLERVGVLVDERERVVGTRMFACGELVADRPRTWLSALGSGLSAARAAVLTLSEDAASRARSSG